MTDPRVIKPQLPLKTVVSAVVIGLLLLAFIIYAVWESGTGIMDAKKTGVIVKKEFHPAPEQQITVSPHGSIVAEHKDGDYILTVEVPQRDGTTKTYDVWMPDQKSFEAVKIGDKFDVGPVLVPGN